MIKEIKYLIFTIIIIIFIFFTGRFYFSETHKKKSYRSFLNIDQKINTYSQKLPILENDTNDIIEYVKKTQKKKPKYHFWKLIDKND
tara:strand:+ start:1650 stop:1910 length:261 start_codon:yes stop_codon:yes gene_type:complete